MPCYCSNCFPSKRRAERVIKEHLNADQRALIACPSHDLACLAYLHGCIQQNNRFLATSLSQPVNLENDGMSSTLEDQTTSALEDGDTFALGDGTTSGLECSTISASDDGMETDLEEGKQLRGASYLDHDGMKTLLSNPESLFILSFSWETNF